MDQRVGQAGDQMRAGIEMMADGDDDDDQGKMGYYGLVDIAWRRAGSGGQKCSRRSVSYFWMV